MLVIVLFGPPGSGKGTQSQKLIKSRSLVHISTGDIFRDHIGNATQLGIEAKKYIDKGDLVPDDLVIKLVEDKISHCLDSKGFIFDGFPRTLNQAKKLDEMLAAHELKIDKMISLEVPEEELKIRIRERAKYSNRIDDQDEKKIENRIKVYLDETYPVVSFYDKQNKYFGVNGVGSIDDIFMNIEKKLNE